MGIDKIATSIHKSLAEINSEAMYGLHHRSQKIETEVVSLRKTNDELKRKFDAYVQEEQRKCDVAEQYASYNPDVLLTGKEQQEDEEKLRALERDLGVILLKPTSSS
jgi:hypothetical protein